MAGPTKRQTFFNCTILTAGGNIAAVGGTTGGGVGVSSSVMLIGCSGALAVAVIMKGGSSVNAISALAAKPVDVGIGTNDPSLSTGITPTFLNTSPGDISASSGNVHFNLLFQAGSTSASNLLLPFDCYILSGTAATSNVTGVTIYAWPVYDGLPAGPYPNTTMPV